jgi:predicted unusual protein kinase regulating ubiquinone biosynthesis (AarF/ABC1/UbiB family)
MTSSRTHIFRLLKWGRTLAKHGALRDLEKHKATPPQVRRLFRIARIGTFQPKEPNYSAALQAIGPAAIKLGQTLATRPDVIGEAAARDLLQLQDSLPPVPFDLIRDEIELSLGKSLDELYSYIDPDPVGAASIAQVHRATTLEGMDVAVKVLTLDWVDGIKISNREGLIAAGHDLDAIASRLVHTFLKQAIEAGYFHADMHQGNLFVKADGTIVAIDFGIMGRINKKARVWLAEILYGLTTGNYKRVAEIHFEAQYVPDHHSMEDFATALRAVGEPMRGKPVSELSVGDMLDGLFAITRDFDMETQPHLLLLQKTMVMVEGIATDLNPTINMWDASGPYVKEWIRGELGPEAAIADRINDDLGTIMMLPDIVRRLDAQLPRQGGAPPPPPLADVELIWEKRKDRQGGAFWRYVLTAIVAGGAGAAVMFMWG